MGSLEAALLSISDLPDILRKAVREVIAVVEENGKLEGFHAIDLVSNLARTSEPNKDIAIARQMVAFASRSQSDFSVASDNAYSEAMTAVMDGCLEVAAACHVRYLHAVDLVQSLVIGSVVPKAQAHSLQDLQIDLSACLDQLPDACLLVLRFTLLQARLPSASALVAAAPLSKGGNDTEKERVVKMEQQLNESSQTLCDAAQLASAALVIAIRLALAEWDVLRGAERCEDAVVSTSTSSTICLASATRIALRAHLSIFLALATSTELDQEELSDVETLLRLSSSEDMRASVPHQRFVVDTSLLSAASDHEKMRLMRLRAVVNRVNIAPERQCTPISTPLSAFAFHGNGRRVFLDLPLVLRVCTLRGSACTARAAIVSLALLNSMTGSEEDGSSLLVLAMELMRICRVLQGQSTLDRSDDLPHVRGSYLITYVLLAALRPTGTRAAPLAADTSTYLATCSLPTALALSAHGNSSQLGDGETMTALRQVNMLGALFSHELVCALGTSQLQIVLPWALPLLLRAWGSSSVITEPTPGEPDAENRRWHVSYVCTLLQARTLHGVFAATSGHGQVAGALHTYIDNFVHKLELQASSPDALWQLLSHSVPFWEAVTAIEEEGALPADGLMAAVTMRLQPVLRALLDTLNHCWHVPVQYTILRILALLVERQRRDSCVGKLIFLHSAVPPIATECLRVLAFYVGPTAGIDLTRASPACSQQLQQAAKNLLALLLDVNSAAVSPLVHAVSAGLGWGSEVLGDM